MVLHHWDVSVAHAKEFECSDKNLFEILAQLHGKPTNSWKISDLGYFLDRTNIFHLINRICYAYFLF